MHKIILCSILGLPLGLAQTDVSARDFTLKGRVVGDGGVLIGPAVVNLQLISSVKSRLQPTTWSTSVESDGLFVFSGLIAGTYRYCVDATDRSWLNPCEWRSSGRKTEFTLIANSPDVDISLQKGVDVKIIVEDPNRVLSIEGKVPGTHLLVGFGENGATFHPVKGIASSADVRTYRSFVPPGVSLGLSVYSSRFKVVNQEGQIAGQEPLQVNFLLGSKETTITFRVSAR